MKYQGNLNRGKICGIHSRENSYSGFRIYGILNTGKWFSMFLRKMLSPAYAWKMEAVGSSETVVPV
jgi:hypothetical protein